MLSLDETPTLPVPGDAIAVRVDDGQLFDAWLESYSLTSRRVYRHYLTEFLRFCQYATVKELVQASPAEVHLNLIHYGAELSASASALAVSAVRSFCAFLCAMRLLPANPVEYVPRADPRPTAERDYLTRDEVYRILCAVDRERVRGARDYCLLLLLAELGLRRHELTSLTCGAIRQTPEGVTYLFFTGKRGKKRRLPLSQHFLRALEDYRRKAHLAIFRDDMPLLPNREGKKMSDQSVYELVVHYAHVAGVAKHITPHSMRHFCITDAAHVESSHLKLKELSGHSSTAMLDRYTHFEQLNEVLEIQKKRGIT